jgi:hypothetical protein
MKKRIGGALATLALAVVALSSHAGAAQFTYQFTMDGPSEFPVNASPATGSGTAIYDDVLQTLTLSATYSGLIGTVSQTHFHGPTTISGLAAGPNPTAAQRQAAANAAQNASIMIGNTTLPGFTLGGQSGVYAAVLDLTQTSIYNVGFLAAQGGSAANAAQAFANGLAAGTVYWNIHTTGTGGFPGGEIRGFSQLIPEPATAGLAALGLACLAAVRRRK